MSFHPDTPSPEPNLSPYSSDLSCAVSDGADEEMDLLDATESRRLAKGAAGQLPDGHSPSEQPEEAFELPINSDGKLVITVPSAPLTLPHRVRDVS